MQGNQESEQHAGVQDPETARRGQREQRVFFASATILNSLSGLSLSEVRDTMRMVLSRYSMAPTPVVPAVLLQQTRVQQTKQARAATTPNQSKKRRREDVSSKSPEMREAMARLTQLKKLIKAKGGEFPKGILPEGHELLEERDEILKKIRAQKILEKSAALKRRDDRPDDGGSSAMQEIVVD